MLSSKADLILYVSPTGNDAASGTRKEPLSSLVGARDHVRFLRDKYKKIMILFEDGEYQLAKTVKFSIEDGREDDGWVCYKAINEGKVVFTSGFEINDWKPLTNFDCGHSRPFIKGLYVGSIPEGVNDCKQLYFGSIPVARSRSAGFNPLNRTPPLFEWNGPGQDTIECPPHIWNGVIYPENTEIHLVPVAPWSMNIVPVKNVDLETGLTVLKNEASYLPGTPVMGSFPEGTAWIENDPGLISAGGRWACDPVHRKIYYLPEHENDLAEVRAPALVEFIRIEGLIDHDGPLDKLVKGIHFSGFRFCCSNRYTVPENRRGLGLQHDWEQYDEPSAVVRFRGAEDCSVRGCVFEGTAGSAIRLDLTANEIEIENNTIKDIGGTGVLLAGYGPGTKNANKHNIVRGNHIENVGRSYWASPAIFIWQSEGNLIEQNTIRYAPYSGIVVSGRITWDPTGQGECSKTIRWNEIRDIDSKLVPQGCNNSEPDWYVREQFLHSRNNKIIRNDISFVVEKLSDGDAIYVSGAGTGNHIVENYLHDIPSNNLAEVIRCDDDQNDVVIERNVIVRFGGYATAIAIKGVATIKSNFVACPLAETTRGLLSLELGPVKDSIIQHNVIIASHKNDRAVFQERTYGDGPIPRLADCMAGGNFYWNLSDPEWGIRHIESENAHGAEVNSFSCNPNFKEPKEGDFTIVGKNVFEGTGLHFPVQLANTYAKNLI